jgi:hypothetical protein
MLVRIYLFVCRHYRQGGLWATAQRQTGNATPAFTDEEVLAIYSPHELDAFILPAGSVRPYSAGAMSSMGCGMRRPANASTCS